MRGSAARGIDEHASGVHATKFHEVGSSGFRRGDHPVLALEAGDSLAGQEALIVSVEMRETERSQIVGC